MQHFDGDCYTDERNAFLMNPDGIVGVTTDDGSLFWCTVGGDIQGTGSTSDL